MTSLNIQKNIPLAPFTTFKIGGPAKFFVEVKAETELLEALDFANKNSLEIFMLGGGSNILFSDNGFDGLVIRMQENEEDKYWAGNSLAGLVNFFKENSFTGLEWAMGIPGTIGGAVRGNAGAYGGQMADNLESVRALEISADRSNIREYEKKDCEFGYRDSLFKKNKKIIVLSVKLRLEKGEKEAIAEKMREIIAKRTAVLPKGFSAGSFFQNPIVSNEGVVARFEKESGAKAKEGKVPAGWLIEGAGFCGKKIGGVMVSEAHANFIVNTGNGKAQDVVMLSSIIKQKVRHEFSVQLKEEVVYVGF
jgi:UDP-N-acetylmuramate dehydrogenase